MGSLSIWVIAVSCFSDNLMVKALIAQVVPDITFGQHIRVVLDVGCGVASFGAYLLSRNVVTMSIAPKDVHENQIQFALERGVPAMIAAFATHRLLYPSQAFDLIHCSRCRINWTRDGMQNLYWTFCFLVTFTVSSDCSFIYPLLLFCVEDGILLLEVNRMLRAGGYFVWAAQPVYKHEEVLEEQWQGITAKLSFGEIENLYIDC